MDRLIYVAMSGAKNTMSAQSSVAHNLANANTPGFRAQMNRLRAVPVQGEGLPTRAFAVEATVGNDFSAGPMNFTGRNLDIAVQGKGWLAVQLPNGTEAYTRAGSLTIDANGVLQTQNGLPVMGDGGPITIPPDNVVEFAADGTVSVVPNTGARASASAIGRLKLVNPDEKTLQRGDDGLFRTAGGNAPVDETVQIASGYVESSNVNVVEQMVRMISMSRNFEMHTQMLQNAQENDRTASQILSSSS